MFAAIDVGSYMLHMKIFEFLPSNVMKEVDSIRYGIDLGTETFSTGRLSSQKVAELCKVLSDFSDIMKYANVVEKRLEDDGTIESVLADNKKMLELAREYDVNYILVEDKYEIDL